MLDIKLMREQTAYVKAALGRAGVAEAEIDQVLECDAQRRRLQHDLDDMRARRTRESKGLRPNLPRGLAGEAAAAMTPEQRAAKLAEMRELGDRIGAGERELTAIEQRFAELMLGIRNIPRDDVPTGSGEADNKVVSSEGEPRQFDFKPLPHWELGESLGIIDFERGVKLSGHAVLCAARGRRAARARADRLDARPEDREQGYLEISPPLMVNYRDRDQHRPSAEERRHDVQG